MAPEQRDPDESLPTGLRKAQLRARTVAPQWVMIIVALATGGLAIYLTFEEIAPAAWLIAAQEKLFDGYYPKLTFALTWVLLLLPFLVLVQGLALLKKRRQRESEPRGP
jgi:hypothetical protein